MGIGQGTTALYTTEFSQEFQAETDSLLRRRFLWFCAIVGGISAVQWIIQGIRFIRDPGEVIDESSADARVPMRFTADFVLATSVVLMLGAAFLYVRRFRLPRTDLLRLSYWLVIAFGTVELVSSMVTQSSGARAADALALIGAVHFIGCLFLPWSPRQALVPIAALAGVGLPLALMFSQGTIWSRILTEALSPLAGLPGVVVCWLRQTRRMSDLKLRFLQTRYGQVRRELVDARRIHESLFPRPVTQGDIRLSYLYEPMHLIGGDFLHAHLSPTDDGESQCVSVVMLDVTGHGIPAALTVNRLSGELHRLFAEDPGIRPGRVLSLLNRYVHLTLATHSVYVTGICLRADPHRRRIEYASAGHPPAFLRAVDGTIEELESTAVVLGALADAEFEAAPRSLRFGPGDSVIAYTDGATECRSESGRMFGVEGVRRVVASRYSDCGSSWPARLGDAVERHRHGPPADDTLVFEVAFAFDKAARTRPAGASVPEAEAT
ncbi:MAG: serine/threonine-protein phosphatase [Phycisphaerales bacterium]|nr:serine/threonine-protein phosphatase [Phycisphaerales bacterium]